MYYYNIENVKLSLYYMLRICCFILGLYCYF